MQAIPTVSFKLARPATHLKVDSETLTLTAGRFNLSVLIDRTMFGGATWTITNPEAIREGDDVPTTAKIGWLASRLDDAPGALDAFVEVISRLTEYSNHLDREEALAADPEKWLAIAEQERLTEEAAARHEATLATRRKAAARRAAEKVEERRLADLDADQAAADRQPDV